MKNVVNDALANIHADDQSDTARYCQIVARFDAAEPGDVSALVEIIRRQRLSSERMSRDIAIVQEYRRRLDLVRMQSDQTAAAANTLTEATKKRDAAIEVLSVAREKASRDGGAAAELGRASEAHRQAEQHRSRAEEISREAAIALQRVEADTASFRGIHFDLLMM